MPPQKQRLTESDLRETIPGARVVSASPMDFESFSDIELSSSNKEINLAASASRQILVWTSRMEFLLVSSLLDQQKVGNRADIGWKKEVWVSTLPVVQAGYEGSLVLTIEQLKNKESSIKALFKDWLFLRDQSGFDWDEETQMITAPPTAWADIIKMRKSCRWHRNNALQNTSLLRELYSTSKANGSSLSLSSPLTSGHSGSPTPFSSRKRARSRAGDLSESNRESWLDRVIEAWSTAVNANSLTVKAIEIFCKEYAHRISGEAFDTITDLFEQTSNAAVFVNLTGKKRSEWVARRSKSNVQGIEDE